MSGVTHDEICSGNGFCVFLYLSSLPEAHSQLGDLIKKADKLSKDLAQVEQSDAASISYNGGTYTGELRNGVPNGQGTMTYASGARYEGEFKDGKPNGQGTSTDKNVGKHTGEYKDGKYHGQGNLTSPKGTTYVGEFKDGKMHGQGTWSNRDGIKYVGEFKDNEFHGQGTMYSAAGAVLHRGWWCRGASANSPC